MPSIEDDIDWKVVDQLHAATIEFSRNCSTIKKLCVTLLIAACTLLTKFNGDSLDISFFVAGFVIPLFFWGLDASSYYYQEKLRGIINTKLNGIKQRNSERTIQVPESITLALNRKDDTRVLRSIFNNSMFLYYFLIGLDLTLFVFFLCGLL